MSRASVCRWNVRRKNRKGATWKRGQLRRPPKLTAAARAHLRKALVHRAQVHGFATDLWTLPRMATVLEWVAGVRIHPAHLSRVLGKMGWSAQRPEKRAVQRDEEAIERWRKVTWPALTKRPAKNAEPSSLLTKAASASARTSSERGPHEAKPHN